MNPLKIILSVAGFFPHCIGGGQVYVYNLAKELQKRSFNVKLLTKEKWNGKKDSYALRNYNYKNISVIAFSINSKFLSPVEAYTGFGPLTAQVLRDILQKHSPDVVHINGMKPALTVMCRELSIPHLITAHHMGIVCPAGGLLRPDYSICDKATDPRDCVPCCCHLKAPKWYVGGILGQMPSWIYRPVGEVLNHCKNLPYLCRGIIYPWLVEESLKSKKILLQQGELFIAPSQAIRELLIRNGCDASKIILIPHGIDPINKVPFEPFTDRLVRFGYVGRIDPSKGFHVILKALELIPKGDSCELHIFGAPRNPWDEEYHNKTLTNYRGIARVVSHGLVHHNQIEKAFSKIDVLIVPSLLPEAFGMVVQESFSAGRPVIVSDVGGLRELVRNGVDGFIVERNNRESLAEAMNKFMGNIDLIDEMSNQIPSVKSIQRYTGEIEELYKNILCST
jgi:glycosyltransferase involved in cell wall biosynthesis